VVTFCEVSETLVVHSLPLRRTTPRESDRRKKDTTDKKSDNDKKSDADKKDADSAKAAA
jgi:hypothetical protein